MQPDQSEFNFAGKRITLSPVNGFMCLCVEGQPEFMTTIPGPVNINTTTDGNIHGSDSIDLVIVSFAVIEDDLNTRVLLAEVNESHSSRAYGFDLGSEPDDDGWREGYRGIKYFKMTLRSENDQIVATVEKFCDTTSESFLAIGREFMPWAKSIALTCAGCDANLGLIRLSLAGLTFKQKLPWTWEHPAIENNVLQNEL